MIETSPAKVSSQSTPTGILTRRQFLALSGSAAAGLIVYSGEIERHLIDIVPRTIALRSLPEAFVGFKIIHISDIHLEEYTEPFFLKDVVRKINSLQPDMVVLTGDFVSNGPLAKRRAIPWSYRCAELLQGLTCQLTYAILGNHDAMIGPAAVTDALVTHGIPVLSNRSVPIERGGQRIWLAGVADAIWQRPDLSSALPNRRNVDREPLILLAHEPDFADAAVHHQVALVLSGHTHGGQVRLPFLPPIYLPELGKKYVEGLFFLKDGMQLYVNRGIGTVGVPIRFRCPPEITVITLAQDNSRPPVNGSASPL